MASRPRTLTAIGFRRELTIFLWIVVGFLVVMVLMLVLLLQSLSERYESASEARWSALADAAAERVRDVSGPSLDGWPTYFQSEYGAAAAEIRSSSGATHRSGEVIEGLRRFERRAGGTIVTLWFDASDVTAAQRVFRSVAILCFAGTIGATILLALFLPRIVRPFERMLESARELEPAPQGDEAAYLVDTFRRTIQTLQQQERELQQLHAREKTRADELERIVQTLKRSIASGFMAISPEGNVVEINEAGRRILGMPDELEVQGRPVGEALPDESLSRTLLESVATRGTILRQEIAVQAGDRVATIGLTQVPLFDSDDRFIGAITLFTDLSEMRFLERRLREVQTLADLGQITAGIAHEFRNSLSTIRGYLKMAAAGTGSETASRRIASADDEAAELGTAVDRLLAFARPMQPSWEPVDLDELTRAIAGRLHDTIPEARIDVRSGGAAWIEGDRALLSRALENLLRNAVESQQLAGRNEEPVRVTIDAGEGVRLEIADSGLGLEAGDAERIILPFQSSKPGGWGLGLPLARRIILLHDGQLEITGRKDQGATVRLTFDRNRASVRAGDLTQKVPPSNATSSARIG